MSEQEKKDKEEFVHLMMSIPIEGQDAAKSFVAGLEAGIRISKKRNQTVNA